MRRIAAAAAMLALASCADGSNPLATVPGQLFCAIELAGGGTIVTAIVRKNIPAGPGKQIVVLATGQTKAYVDAQCAAAAAQTTGAKGGSPVPPPAAPQSVPQTELTS